MSAVLRPVEAPLGVYRDMPIETYHGSGHGISKSGLDDIDQCPAAYFARRLDPHRPLERARAGQLEGTLAHCAVLEPDEFDRRYVALPANAPDRPTEAMRNAKNPSPSSLERVRWWDEFTEAAAGKLIITADQRAVAMAQAASMRRIPVFAEALAGECYAELSAFTEDPATGVLLRCRPDLVRQMPGGSALFDVKTYSSANAAEFARQVARKRYHVQDPFYSDVYAAAADTDVLSFVFIAVETEYPYLSHAMELDAPSLEVGRRAYRRNLTVYADCIATGIWPGYGDDITSITLPRWATMKEDA